MTRKEQKLREAIRAQIRKYLKEEKFENPAVKGAKGSTQTALKNFFKDPEFKKMRKDDKIAAAISFINTLGFQKGELTALKTAVKGIKESNNTDIEKVREAIRVQIRKYLKENRSKLREEKEEIPALPTEEDGRVDVNQLFSILGKSVLGKRFARLGSKPDAARAEAIIKFAKMIGVPTSKISDIVSGLLAQQGEEEPMEEPIEEPMDDMPMDDAPMDDMPEEPVEEPMEEPEEEELPEE
jgi:hypothetical protein